MFSEEAAHHFPASREWDHAIDLKPDALTTLDCKVYPLSPGEDNTLQTFLSENLDKGYIRQSKSPYAFPFFFIKKKNCYDCTPQTIIFLLYSLSLALRTVRLLSYLFTCFTLALTVPHTRASVPIDAHPLCTVRARLSSPLPYVSLHLPCTIPDPLTCVVPRPLYVFS